MTRLSNCTAKVLAAVALFGSLGCQLATPIAMTNEEKLARIEAMVARYQGKFDDVPGVDAATLRSALDAGDVVLVDVRTAEEQAVSMIAGAISSEEFERRLDEFEGAAVTTYCTIGQRSGDYARKLRRNGWQASNFDGSVLAWTHAGGELVDAEGQPTRRVHVFGERWNLAADGYEPVW